MLLQALLHGLSARGKRTQPATEAKAENVVQETLYAHDKADIVIRTFPTCTCLALACWHLLYSTACPDLNRLVAGNICADLQ